MVAGQADHVPAHYPGTRRSTEIMTIVREMSGCGSTQQEIAQRARTSQGHVTQATRVLREAPDLAAQVEAGKIGIATAYRMLYERELLQITASAVWPSDPA
jgi:hypothetical protein